MVNPRRFYTYAYLREDGTPYYIGKGVGHRAYYKYNNDVRPPKDKTRIILLKQNVLEEEAFKHEIYMISVYGRIDLGTGILRNKTNGGDGSSGVAITEETRKKQSKIKKGKNNSTYGTKWWNDEYGNTKRSVKCPGKGWVVGMNKETRKKRSTLMKGKKWWNDGCGNSILSMEYPGEGWFPGRGKNKLLWWNDGKTQKRCEKCPGEGWFPGRGKIKIKA